MSLRLQLLADIANHGKTTEPKIAEEIRGFLSRELSAAIDSYVMDSWSWNDVVTSLFNHAEVAGRQNILQALAVILEESADKLGRGAIFSIEESRALLNSISIALYLKHPQDRSPIEPAYINPGLLKSRLKAALGKVLTSLNADIDKFFAQVTPIPEMFTQPAHKLETVRIWSDKFNQRFKNSHPNFDEERLNRDCYKIAVQLLLDPETKDPRSPRVELIRDDDDLFHDFPDLDIYTAAMKILEAVGVKAEWQKEFIAQGIGYERKWISFGTEENYQQAVVKLSGHQVQAAISGLLTQNLAR